MKSPPFIRSFHHAWRGLRLAFRLERSFRIQIGVALLVVLCAVILPLQSWERVVLLVVTMFVLVLELVNSSVERLVDMVKPRLSEYAGDIKDLMAGAVLLAALFAAILGVLILFPYLRNVLGRV